MILQKIKIKKIMYATDLSENALYAFSYAVSLANLYNAGITILHALAEDHKLDDKIVGYVSSSQWEKIKRRHEDDARNALIGKAGGRAFVCDVLDQFCRDAQDNLEEQKFDIDEIMVTRGHPAEQIIAQAKEKDIDLIVMGTHRSGTLTDAMLGSTARRVLRRAKIPVLVIRLPEGSP
jgi:nucleotide-binding universal stress UspA family protein